MNAEQRELAADRQMLARIAEETGGRSFWATDDLTGLGGLIPDRSVVTPADVESPLCDTPMIVILLTGLFSTEWILRRALSLP